MGEELSDRLARRDTSSISVELADAKALDILKRLNGDKYAENVGEGENTSSNSDIKLDQHLSDNKIHCDCKVYNDIAVCGRVVDVVVLRLGEKRKMRSCPMEMFD